MKIKIDENLPASLALLLSELGHDADHVDDEGLTSAPDEQVINAAIREERLLITQDVKFADVRHLPPLGASAILLVRVRSDARRALVELIVNTIKTSDIAHWPGNLITATENKVRLRKLEK